MTRRLVRLGVGQVVIERPDGPVVQALLAAGLGVVVLPGRQVKALRGRDGAAGKKDDRLDAYVLADALRIDGHRLVPLRPDAPATAACGWSAGPARRRRRRAVAAWNKSLKTAERLAMPYEQGRAHYELGQHLPPGHPARQEHLSRAWEILTDIGASYELTLVQAAMSP